jgi:hypothetical protein
MKPLGRRNPGIEKAAVFPGLRFAASGLHGVGRG